MKAQYRTGVTLFFAILVALAAVACSDDKKSGTPGTASATSASGTPSTAGPSVPAGTPGAGTTPNVNPTPRDDQVPPFLEVTGAALKPGASTTAQPLLKDVRIGKNDGYDRIVFEFAGALLPGYQVRYVTSASECGSGRVVTANGPALLSIALGPAAAHDASGMVTFAPKQVNGGFASIKEAKATCDFEGIVGWVVGAERKPFRVVELQNPARIAVDIRQ